MNSSTHSNGTVNKRRDGTTKPRYHGWRRASDSAAPSGDGKPRGPRRYAPAGTSFLLFLAVVMLTAMGISRVHMRTRVLELGAEISRLTAEQARLLDQKRRLEAERAYLRHPDHLLEQARDRYDMVPIPPGQIQRIKLLSEAQ